jgi:hypothetical protein
MLARAPTLRNWLVLLRYGDTGFSPGPISQTTANLIPQVALFEGPGHAVVPGKESGRVDV